MYSYKLILWYGYKIVFLAYKNLVLREQVKREDEFTSLEVEKGHLLINYKRQE